MIVAHVRTPLSYGTDSEDSLNRGIFSLVILTSYYAKLHFYVHNPVTLCGHSVQLFRALFRENISFFSSSSLYFYSNEFHFFSPAKFMCTENWLFRKSRISCTKRQTFSQHTFRRVELFASSIDEVGNANSMR